MKSLPPHLRLSPLALVLPLIATAHAETPADAGASAATLDKVEVVGSRVEKASSPKYTEPLRDTPQSITVVGRETLDQQNLLGLREILGTLPGITFGAGEGGGGYGDSINLRGFTAGTDITVDNVRDSALYTRSDSFNLESLELINGANSAMSGAGSVGGNINLVSKTAHEGDAHAFALGAGSDSYGRVTADSNFDFGGGTALRLNAMAHQNDVPGRDHEFFNRWGVAPSLAFGLGTERRFRISYLHQEDEGHPQYGVPYALNAYNDGPLPGVDPERYYGYRNVSTQDSTVDSLTGIFEIDVDDRASLRTLARWQRVDQHSNVTAPGGTWCLYNGVNPFTGATCAGGQPAGTWSPLSGPRGYVRDTRNTIAVVQSDLTLRLDGERVSHTLVAGLSISRETFALETGGVFFNADGSPVPNTNAGYPLVDLRNPYNLWTGPQNYFRAGKTEGDLDNRAIYAFDTLRFGERWLLNLGARYERNDGASTTWNVSTANATRGQLLSRNPTAENDDTLFSYRAGLVFKPNPHGSVYLSYANAKTPSKASVNGSCTPTSSTGTANCGVDPESARLIELGTKWDVPGRRLALTAAVFRNERTNFRVADPDPTNIPGEQALDGRARVDGVSLGIAGNPTRDWAIFANYTFLDSEVLSSVSDYCRRNPNTRIVSVGGVATAVNADGRACANSTHFPDPQKGSPLTNTPRHSGSVWTTYSLNKWTFGVGSTYQGGFLVQNTRLPLVNGAITAATLADTNAARLYRTEDYWVHRAMVGYQINDRLGLQFNINNLSDKTYYTRIRNSATSSWATPGDGRSFVLTANYRF